MITSSSPANCTITETRDTALIHQLAHATWGPTYQPILAQEQIEYMLAQLYSKEALGQQIEEGQVFLLLRQKEIPAAFAAYSLYKASEQIYKLNKLYIHPTFQGMGFGRMLLQEVVQRTKALGGKALELNVHRQNPARHFYQKHGFQIHQVADIPFGPFTLNDYIMRRPL